MNEGTNRLGLSCRQQEFADRMDCRTVTYCVDQSVCFYRVIAHQTIRWIIAIDGSVLDWTVFHSNTSSRAVSESRDVAALSPRAAA
jgi:hypothetical protein